MVRSRLYWRTNMPFFKKDLLKSIFSIFLLAIIIVCFLGAYVIGLIQGYNQAKSEDQGEIISFLNQLNVNRNVVLTLTPTPFFTPSPSLAQKKTTTSKVEWGGPDLWE